MLVLISRDTYVILFDNIMIQPTIECIFLIGRFRFAQQPLRLPSIGMGSFHFRSATGGRLPPGLCNHTKEQHA